MQRLNTSDVDYFMKIADLMPAKISNADAAGNVIYFNKKWLDYAGMSFEDLRDFGYHQMLHPDELETFQRGLAAAAQNGEPFEMEMRFKDKDGNFRWHLNIAAPVKDEEGNTIMWVGSTTEMHDKILYKTALEQELTLKNEVLELRSLELMEKNKQLESFAYVASHDLQEPLRKISLYTSLIAKANETQPNAEIERYIHKAEQSATRMQSLIRDLLSYSRTNSGELIFEQCDLNKMLQQVLADYAEMISITGATITADQLPVIQGVPFQLSQLLDNLIGNALKFTVPGKPALIKISCEEVIAKSKGKKETFMKLSFADNGIGFNDGYNQLIFEVFKRLHLLEQYDGTGIGLAIVKRVAENHGGYVTAHGVEGEGALFEIFIPLVQTA